MARSRAWRRTMTARARRRVIRRRQAEAQRSWDRNPPWWERGTWGLAPRYIQQAVERWERKGRADAPRSVARRAPYRYHDNCEWCIEGRHNGRLRQERLWRRDRQELLQEEMALYELLTAIQEGGLPPPWWEELPESRGFREFSVEEMLAEYRREGRL